MCVEKKPGMMQSKQFVKVYFTKAVVPPWGRMRLLWLSVYQTKGEEKACGNKKALQEEVPFAFASATRSLPKNSWEGLAALWACPGCVAHCSNPNHCWLESKGAQENRLQGAVKELKRAC